MEDSKFDSPALSSANFGVQLQHNLEGSNCSSFLQVMWTVWVLIFLIGHVVLMVWIRKLMKQVSDSW